MLKQHVWGSSEGSESIIQEMLLSASVWNQEPIVVKMG